MRVEEAEQRQRSAEAALTAELDGVRKEHSQQVELYQRLERESALRNADANTFYTRLDTLQVIHIDLRINNFSTSRLYDFNF